MTNNNEIKKLDVDLGYFTQISEEVLDKMQAPNLVYSSSSTSIQSMKNGRSKPGYTNSDSHSVNPTIYRNYVVRRSTGDPGQVIVTHNIDKNPNKQEVSIVKLRKASESVSKEIGCRSRSTMFFNRRDWNVSRFSSVDSSNNLSSKKQIRLSLTEQGFGKIESYKQLEKIGSGAYSKVYRGSSTLLDGKEVALKHIQLEAKEGAPCTAIREISLLRDLKHANIVTLHDIIYTKGRLTLVMEYVGKDLKRFMESHSFKLDLKLVKLLSLQLFRALEFCHARHILHRDIKPHNLLINGNNELKLADFEIIILYHILSS